MSFEKYQTMLEPVWEQERPSPRDMQRMWKELQITHSSMQHPAIDDLLHHLRASHVNGGAEFACFDVAAHPTLHWFGSRNRLEEIQFFDKFLSSTPVAEALPKLEIDESTISDTDFQWASSLTLDGELAETLVRGGAYHRFAGTAREAKNMAARFCDALFGDRFTDVQMYKTHATWSNWFYDIAWDATWLGVDKRENRIWLLCVTDTD